MSAPVERQWSDQGQGNVSPRAKSANPSRSLRGGRTPSSSPAPPRPEKQADPGTARKRRRVVAELVQSEEVYVNALATIVRVYRTPLSLVLSERELESLFLNVVALQARHEALLKMLLAHPLDDDDYPVGGFVSSICTGPAWTL